VTTDYFRHQKATMGPVLWLIANDPDLHTIWVSDMGTLIIELGWGGQDLSAPNAPDPMFEMLLNMEEAIEHSATDGVYISPDYPEHYRRLDAMMFPDMHRSPVNNNRLGRHTTPHELADIMYGWTKENK
jgi:hypothetical protein